MTDREWASVGMDRISVPARSRMMAGIRNKNTGPERQVRAALFAAGDRFRPTALKLLRYLRYMRIAPYFEPSRPNPGLARMADQWRALKPWPAWLRYEDAATERIIEQHLPYRPDAVDRSGSGCATGECTESRFAEGVPGETKHSG
jgi:DNA mismatch endonuclease Vsr